MTFTTPTVTDEQLERVNAQLGTLIRTATYAYAIDRERIDLTAAGRVALKQRRRAA